MQQKNNQDEKRIYISVYLRGEGFVPAGFILFNEIMNYAGFIYFKSYSDNDYPPLNPGTLNYKTHKTLYFPIDVKTNPNLLDRTFWELLPTQGDFGTNVLISRYPEYFSMNNAQKLYFLGSRIVGGLSCYVEKPEGEQNIVGNDWLDEIRKDSVAFFTKRITSIKHVQAMDALTSYGGVRPKAMFKDEQGDFWIAKFNLPSDPYNMARVEHTSMQMSRDCGLDVPDTKVLTLNSGQDVFLTKRFDRTHEHRMHGLSFFSVIPAIDFERKRPEPGRGHSAEVMGKVVSRFSEEKKQDQKHLARKLLVDIGFNNTDNHLRNIRFILNENNSWCLSPSFDILFDPRDKPHTYSPAGLSRHETHLNNDDVIRKIADFTNLTFEQVAEYSDHTKKVLGNFHKYAISAQLSETDILKLENAISIGTLGPEVTFQIEQKKRQKISFNRNHKTAPELKPAFMNQQ